MSASRPRLVDTSVTRGGIGGIALRGEELALTVFPEAGGKILDLVHRPTGFNFLWHNPRVELQKTYAGAFFDDLWCGGWDELFPTDGRCEVDGNTYHDHGDLWIGPWEWEVERDDGSSAVLYMRRYSTSLPCLMERWISLERAGAVVEVRYRLANFGARPVRFVWNVHVAHAITTDSRLHLPARLLGVQPPYLGRAEGNAGDVSWPWYEDRDGVGHDLSRMPPVESGLTEFFFTRDLEDGWCAVTYPSAGVGLALTFDRIIFRNVWLFCVYGGWRGHYLLLTEPWTSEPGSLADNVASGLAAVLEAGSALETEVRATVLTGVASDIPGGVSPAPVAALRGAFR